MKLFIFNNQEQLIKVIEPLEAVSEEEINKIHKIEATLRYSDVFDSNNDVSESATYIGHKDYDNDDIFHFYKIDHVTKTSLTEVKLVAVNSFYDDMQSDGYIKDFRPKNKSVMSILQTLLEGTRWQLGIVKSTELVTLNFYYLSRKEAISKLLEVTNIEIRPRVELSKNTIIRRYLDVFNTLGADHGKVFTHGKDLLTVSEKASQGAIYTAAIGRGKGEEITDSNGQATGGYGRRITFKDVVWQKNFGNPVDKPKGQEFIEIPELTVKYGFANGTKPRLKIIEFQDEEDPEKLLRLTYAWLEKNSRVQVEYKATVNNVGNCNLGDTVGIYNPTIGIKYKTRVFSVKRNLIDNNLTEFGIGDKVTTSPFGRTAEIAKNLKNLEDNTIYWLDQLRDKIKDNFLNEDGYNYDLGVNNKYHLPAGLYSFDKPIDQEPTKVVYVGAGKVAIANSKLPDGKWDWKTFLNGNGATLDLVNTGTLRAGIIQSSDGSSYWNLDTGEFKISQKVIEDVTTKIVEKKIEEKKPELKGKDGKIPAFNQLIGTRFPSLDVVKPLENTQLKLNKKDYNGQNSVEVMRDDNNIFQGIALKANINGAKKGQLTVIRVPFYVFDDSEGNNFSLSFSPIFENEPFNPHPIFKGEIQKAKWQLAEIQIPFDEDLDKKIKKIAFVSFGNAHFKIAEPYMAVSDAATDKWLPAIEDMQSYSLTASARIEGSYLNENLSNCKVYLDVYNNGEIVRASTTETPLKIEIKKLVASGYTASGEVTLDSNGLVQNINIPNGTKDGQPIEVVFEVTCGENKTVASARLNNTIDKQLLTETISKVKTFESTIDKFESKIGEINKQKFKMAYNIENICSESGIEKKGNDLYFNAKTPLKKDKEYYILADLEDVPENQNTRLYNAKDNGDSKIISNSLNVWRVSYANDQIRVNIYPLGTNTKVKNVEIYEVPEFENPKENLIKITNEDFYNQGNIVIVAQETLVKNDVYTLEFEVGNSVNGSMSTTFFNGVTNLTVKKPLVKGLNKLTIRGAGISNTILVSIPINLSISNVKFYKEKFSVGYKNEYNISEMESKINQTKSEIDLSVKKDKVINSINLSGEGVKINADKVDISGTLSAYTGKIGTFSIGLNDHANYGRWITGVSQYQIGISDGTNGREGAAIWVNWGNSWNQIGGDAWYVQNDGQMFCKNHSYFGKKITAPGGIDVYKSNVYGLASSGHTTPIWWSEFEQLKSQISDKRLKENVRPTKVNALDTLNQIEMVEFNWKKDGKFEKLGAIAQQVENIDNSLVVQHFEDKDTPTDYLRINYFDTIPYLIKAVQELTDIVDGLQEEIKELKERS